MTLPTDSPRLPHSGLVGQTIDPHHQIFHNFSTFTHSLVFFNETISCNTKYITISLTFFTETSRYFVPKDLSPQKLAAARTSDREHLQQASQGLGSFWVLHYEQVL